MSSFFKYSWNAKITGNHSKSIYLCQGCKNYVIKTKFEPASCFVSVLSTKPDDFIYPSADWLGGHLSQC